MCVCSPQQPGLGPLRGKVFHPAVDVQLTCEVSRSERLWELALYQQDVHAAGSVGQGWEGSLVRSLGHPSAKEHLQTMCQRTVAVPSRS